MNGANVDWDRCVIVQVGLQRQNASIQAEESLQQSWRWGELPSPPVNRASPPKSMVRSSRDSSPTTVQNQEGDTTRPKDPAVRSDGAVQTPEQGINRRCLATDKFVQNLFLSPEKEVQRSMLSHMFSFMRQSKKMRSQTAAGGGIYLDDLDVESLDPELAALYITQSSFHHHHKLQSPSNLGCSARLERHI